MQKQGIRQGRTLFADNYSHLIEPVFEARWDNFATMGGLNNTFGSLPMQQMTASALSTSHYLPRV